MTHSALPPSGNFPILPPGGDDPAEFAPGTARIVVIGVLVSIFGGVVIIIIVRVFDPVPPAYVVGDCVQVVDSVQVTKVDCAAGDALYEVGVYLDDPAGTCPGDDYSAYRQTGGTKQEFTLCLMLNAGEGDCFALPAATLGEETRTPCDSDTATRRVTKVVDGTADRNVCASGSRDDARVYPRPARTVCLAPMAA
jgi:hypothetical protein